MNYDETYTKYPLSEDEVERLRKWRHFKGHSDQPKRYIRINQVTRRAAQALLEMCPRSRELSLALTKLEEARLHASMAIMKNEEVCYGEERG